jgi:hypothetical protein
MGWVLKSGEAAQQLAQRHRHACLAFSLVTFFFHVFFTQWIIMRLLWWWGPALVVASVAAMVVLARRWNMLGVAFVVLAVSMGTMVGSAQSLNFALPLRPPHGTVADVFYLIPVCVFGFALCPYLDLTFLAARANCGAGARASFGIGFGVFFLLMIVYSLGYAQPLAAIVGQPDATVLGRTFALLLGIHMAVQTAFTMLVHGCQPNPALGDGKRVGPLMLVMAAGIVVASVLGSCAESEAVQLLGLPSGESVYRVFMGFYGLVFPAYVWVCMIPDRGRGPRRFSLMVWGVAVAVALPFFWVGFIGRQMGWLVPGVGIVVAAGLVAMLRTRRGAGV